jgi:chromosome segregation ATPase
MTPADLDALIERLLRYSIRINGELMMEQAAAALIQLRDSEALARGKIAEQMIEIGQLQDRLEGYFKRLTSMDGLLANAEAELDTQNRALAQCRALLKQEIDDVVPLRDKVATLEAKRDALAKDAERWRKAEEIFKDMGWKERIIVCKVCDDDKCQEWHRVPTITKAIDAAMDAAKEK